MMLPAEQIERNCLRQGDILRDVSLLGAIGINEVTVSHPIGGGTGPQQTWTVHSRLESGQVMVLSHCCEVAKENGVKLTSVILAPLRDVAKATAPDKIVALKSSNMIGQGESSFSFLKYFFVDPANGVGFPAGSVVDFSKLFSVRKTAYDYLLERKIGQLSDVARAGMALKLALYFHRTQPAAA